MIFRKLKLSSYRNVSQNIHDGKLKVSQNKLLAKKQGRSLNGNGPDKNLRETVNPILLTSEFLPEQPGSCPRLQ